MRCPGCGTDVPDDAAFCHICGRGINGQPNQFVASARSSSLSSAPQPLPSVGFPFAQLSPYSYPPIDLKHPGIAMIIGIMLPGFGHVYCGKILQGLLIFTIYMVVLIGGIFVGVLTLGLGFLIVALLLITIMVLQLLSVKDKAEEYNRFVRQTGRPPW